MKFKKNLYESNISISKKTENKNNNRKMTANEQNRKTKREAIKIPKNKKNKKSVYSENNVLHCIQIYKAIKSDLL